MRRICVGACLSIATVLAVGACSGSSSGRAGSAPARVSPATAATADRTITIKAVNGLRFDPTTVTVRSGETVTFRVENDSTLVHEFDVGDAAFQSQHEKEMEAMGNMVMPDEPTGIAVTPGQTKQISFTFSGSGTIIYGCHEPGHYAAGMKGQIIIK